MPPLQLQSLTFTNFRRFKALEIDFHPDLTVLGAKNGQGKTTVLDAATIALGTFVGAFDLGRSKPISQQDVRYHRGPGHSESEQVFPARVEAQLSTLTGSVTRALNSAKGKTTIKDAAELTRLGRALMEQVRALQPIDLPLVAYYGSGRLWNAYKNMSRKVVLSESRTMGYEDCFSAASSFTQVQQWMSKATLAALQQQSLDADRGHPIAGRIKGIQRAVDSVLSTEGWEGFHYSVQHEELAIRHPEIGTLPVSLLSDGVRAMVSLVADMAWRCAKLNPHMGEEAARRTAGTAFIDEVDMHLHPQWQQRVIGTLREAFPRIQWVVTTQSPQVLSTVDAESIRLIRHEYDPETGETVFDWSNLFGSCDRQESCGKHKDRQTYDHSDLIKLDEEDPEHFLRFLPDGSVAPADHLSSVEHRRAEETIRVFNLNGPLRHRRKSHVMGYVQTAEEIFSLALEFEDSDWRPILDRELNDICGKPFETAIRHVLQIP